MCPLLPLCYLLRRPLRALLRVLEAVAWGSVSVLSPPRSCLYSPWLLSEARGAMGRGVLFWGKAGDGFEDAMKMIGAEVGMGGLLG